MSAASADREVAVWASALRSLRCCTVSVDVCSSAVVVTAMAPARPAVCVAPSCSWFQAATSGRPTPSTTEPADASNSVTPPVNGRSKMVMSWSVAITGPTAGSPPAATNNRSVNARSKTTEPDGVAWTRSPS